MEYYWATRSDSNNITYGGLMTHLRHYPHDFPDYLRRSDMSRATGEISRLQSAMHKLYGKNTLFYFYGNDF